MGLGPVEARAGSDLRIYITEALQGAVSLRAGGSVDLYLPANVSGQFALNSGGENTKVNFNHQDRPTLENIDARHYEFSLGSGGPVVEIQAGSDIRLSDEPVEPKSISGELERRERAWLEARERRGSPAWSTGFGFDRNIAWADMVSRRAQEAARRAEQRSQASMRRTEEQIRQAAERQMKEGFGKGEFNFDFPFDFPTPPGGPIPSTPPAPPPAPKVTDQERLMVLQMLQENKITVEQAERLLAALEGRFNQ